MDASNRKPSADEARANHCALGKLVWVQVLPALVEEYTPPPYVPATNREPSAEEEMRSQAIWGALVSLQVFPALVEV